MRALPALVLLWSPAPAQDRLRAPRPGDPPERFAELLQSPSVRVRCATREAAAAAPPPALGPPLAACQAEAAARGGGPPFSRRSPLPSPPS